MKQLNLISFIEKLQTPQQQSIPTPTPTPTSTSIPTREKIQYCLFSNESSTYSFAYDVFDNNDIKQYKALLELEKQKCSRIILNRKVKLYLARKTKYNFTKYPSLTKLTYSRNYEGNSFLKSFLKRIARRCGINYERLLVNPHPVLLQRMKKEMELLGITKDKFYFD